MNHSRRQFLNRVSSEAVTSDPDEITSYQADLYFTSFESCYPFLAEARPLLDEKLKAYFASPNTDPADERALLHSIFVQQQN
ncbi:hypothetical protein GCM10009347_07620 [Shewanella algicola]|uniref:Uncharacterized protein n=1 Tax=Shewanella algicola TaxID=640633 RepID=A0A9X1Z3T2_9GAMM|nr:hypothetical protein [Shewanella algicola]MCL1104392.1 hypothetical protein [Shewanella algicola]GGP42409.1 hypothetical protein GCM10009347_07620 [Shewanella algicola]